ncbi:MAG: 6,7-dimethyl-8-ribityllumazine synthase [Bacteroidetes bacterium GWE2_29_8]|nr:MAG: 6,7-dimethyl-8-ribityllumazine synthase [Bacteroidetes bacterium GWE2_29_8]OFY14632.1 MAG: 6,7-dimethyl-8-ribityllumazine synthase [Bacteroidetes bacterium GWF2_29_10]
MSTNFNPSINTEIEALPSIEFAKIGIVVSEWYYDEINSKMLQGAVEVLKAKGVKDDNIIIKKVPGSFELPLGALKFIEFNTNVNAVICIGCVIKGDTKHNEYISQAVANEIGRLNTDYSIPIIFGVLTTENLQQAVDRAGGKHGNKGVDSAIAAIKMIDLQASFASNYNNTPS